MKLNQRILEKISVVNNLHLINRHLTYCSYNKLHLNIHITKYPSLRKYHTKVTFHIEP
jgi:hypothetical protein